MINDFYKKKGVKYMNEEILKLAVENISEDELQEIAAAGDIYPEITSYISITTAGSTLMTCGNGLGCC